MASCNWAFGCAIALFVIVLILILVLVIGAAPDDKEEIVVLPAPAPASSPAATVSGSRREVSALKAGKKPVKDSKSVKSKARAEHSSAIRELQSAEEVADLLSSSSEPVIVLFYANYCGHCKQMMPDFEQEAEEAKNRLGIIISRVESGKLHNMAKVASKIPHITGFPTMVVKKGNGQIETHVGRKDRETISRLIRYNSVRLATGTCGGARVGGAKADAAANKEMIEFHSFQEACDALQGDDKIMVMAYADWCGFCKAMKSDYEALLANAPEDVSIGRINAKLITKASVCNGKRGQIDVINAYPTLMYNDGKSKILKTTGKRTLKELMEMIESKPKKK